VACGKEEDKNIGKRKRERKNQTGKLLVHKLKEETKN
jgi:hypothetical protein